MKFLPLVWRNLTRKKVRTFLTLGCIFIAFLLFGVLMAVRAAFSMGVEIAGADRLTTIHRVSLIQLLPRSYHARIAAVDGVTLVTHANWFGGYYQDPSNGFFANMAVEPESSFLRCTRSTSCRRIRSAPGSPTAAGPSSAPTWRGGSAGTWAIGSR
jgi:putative ABC transport system permease protein